MALEMLAGWNEQASKNYAVRPIGWDGSVLIHTGWLGSMASVMLADSAPDLAWLADRRTPTYV